MIQRKQFTKLQPMHALMCAIINQAKKDASKGDLSALAWLLLVGLDYVQTFDFDADNALLQFCAGVMERVDRRELQAAWR